MKPIYEPKGRAKEYGDYAINIYTGCPHRCYYCFAPTVLRKDREKFHTNVEPREGIVEAVKRQLDREQITGKTIHLCFTCDPYPTGYDTTPTREIIKAIKDSGNHVQILTKGDGSRDFDLLGPEDWYGITLDGATTRTGDFDTAPLFRYWSLINAHAKGIKTWVSFEPVLCAENVLGMIKDVAPHADKIKIGKLNYYPSDIDWKEFGHAVEAQCKRIGIDYYIKDSLREVMTEAQNAPHNNGND